MKDWILFMLIVFGLVFFLAVVPGTVAYGIVSGRIDPITLEPVKSESIYKEGYQHNERN